MVLFILVSCPLLISVSGVSLFGMALVMVAVFGKAPAKTSHASRQWRKVRGKPETPEGRSLRTVALSASYFPKFAIPIFNFRGTLILELVDLWVLRLKLSLFSYDQTVAAGPWIGKFGARKIYEVMVLCALIFLKFCDPTFSMFKGRILVGGRILWSLRCKVFGRKQNRRSWTRANKLFVSW